MKTDLTSPSGDTFFDAEDPHRKGTARCPKTDQQAEGRRLVSWLWQSRAAHTEANEEDLTDEG